MKKSRGTTVLLGALALLFWADDAHAYLDPGTGSMILQMLAAGFLGGLYTLKVYWGRVSLFVRNLTGLPRARGEHGRD